jgi:hypothetical protein
MIEVSADDLRSVVEAQHGCPAQLVEAVAVSESFLGQLVWEGVVHVFALQGHRSAEHCYAWSSPVEGSSRRRFYAVLGMPPINSAADAVRAAIVADRRADKAAEQHGRGPQRHQL